LNSKLESQPLSLKKTTGYIMFSSAYRNNPSTMDI